MKNQQERMIAGKLYIAEGEDIVRASDKSERLTYEFNHSRHTEKARRQALLRELFGSIGKNFVVKPTFRCDYGSNIYIGDNFFANYDCMMVDVTTVHIGDNVFFGPRVHVFTAAHPIDSKVRNTNLEFGKPVKIGNSVWVGGNTVINPGVTIGSNVVIGSGSVVTRDIPDNVVAVGNPCRVIRDITDEDKIYWEKLQDEYHIDRNA